MKLSHAILEFAANRLLKKRSPQAPRDPHQPRILVIRRNRMGDMIYTLPLLHALRRHYPQAYIIVACDPAGAPIAQACDAVNETILLASGLNPWVSLYANAKYLQDFDWVIAAKGGYDRRLAVLTRLTNAPVRVGFSPGEGKTSSCYTDVVEQPPAASEEHQIETLLRLLKPLGIIQTIENTIDLHLNVPMASRDFANRFLDAHPNASHRRLMLINISSTVPLKFGEEDFISLAGRILGSTDLVIGFVGAPTDQQKAHEVALCMASPRIMAIDTPGPLDLAALLEQSAFLLTPEGGAAHLAASVGTPALVLWSEGPFKKWHSRGRGHAFVHADYTESRIPVERVWQALQPYLPAKKKDDIEQQWADMLQQMPPPPNL